MNWLRTTLWVFAIWVDLDLIVLMLLIRRAYAGRPTLFKDA